MAEICKYGSKLLVNSEVKDINMVVAEHFKEVYWLE